MKTLVAFAFASIAIGCSGSPDDPSNAESESQDLNTARATNPILGDTQCPDPSVRQFGANYFMVCTGPTFGGGNAAFALRWSHDLAHWHDIGHVFENGGHPKWAVPPQNGGR